MSDADRSSSAAAPPRSRRRAAYREAGGRRAVVLVTAERPPALPAPAADEGVRCAARREPAELALEDEGWYAAHDVERHRARRVGARSRPRGARAPRAGASSPTTRRAGHRRGRRVRPPVTGRRRPARVRIAAHASRRARAAARPPRRGPGRRRRRRLHRLRGGRRRWRGAAAVTLVAPEERARRPPAWATRSAGASRPGCARQGVDCAWARRSAGIDAGPRPRAPATARRSTADAVLLGRRRRARARRSPRPPGSRSATAGRRSTRTSAPPTRACWPPATSRRAGTRGAGRPSARRALGRRAGPGRGRRAAPLAGEEAQLGRRARLLVDDRRPHAEVRGLGRRLRRGASRAGESDGERSPPGTAATVGSSACSRTTRRRLRRGRAECERAPSAGDAPRRRLAAARAVVVVPARDEQERIGACLRRARHAGRASTPPPTRSCSCSTLHATRRRRVAADARRRAALRAATS